MPAIIECVVNVSEGRDRATLDAFAEAIESVAGCALLHQDVGAGAHRTVFTLAGSPPAVFAGAYQVYRVAQERIDMRRHQGEHPRSGAVDVCPFVPVSGVTEREIRAGTRVLAERVAVDFDLPVFLYERSATAPHRTNLAAIRKGEYEGLAEKLRQPDWQPDFGPALPHPRLGITVMGVRPFLIAWNINLAPGVSEATAKQLAGMLRESGRPNRRPGLFPGLKSIGWYIPEYGRCQISCNVVDPEQVDLAKVYLTASHLASERGATVTGSELIGLIPRKYLRAAAKNFCFEENYTTEMDTAVTVLGLGELEDFNWRHRVLEELLQKRNP